MVSSKFHIVFFTLVCIFLLAFVTPHEQSLTLNSNFYERGLEQKNKGNYQKALKIWLQAKAELQTSEFKIGQSFIELATARQLHNYYQEASEMYFWGLKEQIVEKNKTELIREIEFIEPLLGFRTYKDLKNKAKDADASVLQKIKGFWKKNDPTPLSSYNERLIEHWLRVQYAKENFFNSQSNEIDDRGKLYIRYGKPDVSRQDQFAYNSGTVNYLLDQQMTGRLNPFESENFTSSAMKTLQFNLESRIRSLHQYPQYEVWVYDNLIDEPEGAVFIFGTSDGKVYRKKNSVEDFIPTAAFNVVNLTEQSLFITEQSFSSANDDNQSALSVNTSGGSSQVPDVNITPALIMQLMYYQQLSAIDSYFGNAYDEMLSRYLDLSGHISTSLARQFENSNIGKLVKLQGRVPRQKSTEEKAIAKIPVQSYAYRFIDDSNNVFNKVFVVNNIEKIATYDFLKSNNSLNIRWNEYKLNTGIRIMDNENNIVHFQSDTVDLSIRFNSNLTSIFDVPTDFEYQEFKAASEFFKEGESLTDNSTIFNNAVVGIGESNIQISPNLDTHTLMMSDVVTGFGNQPRKGQAWLPFKIAHEHKIPEGKSLKLYYEVYNLTKDSTGIANFDFTYRVRSADKGFLKLFNRTNNKEQLSITFNNETDRNRFSNTLEIEAEGRGKGKYELLIILKDNESGREIEKNIVFEVI